MNLSKWKPWNWFKDEEADSRPVPVRNKNNSNVLPVLRLQEDMDKLFHNFFNGFPQVPSLLRDFPQVRVPRLDISETDDAYIIEADVPGMNADDIDVTVEDRVLRIRGERQKQESDEREHRTERIYGMFERVLSLPHDADESQVSASFKNGVLRLTVDRSQTKPEQGRKIAVSTD